MQKLRRIFMSFSVLALFIFAGCQQAGVPQKSPDQILKEAMVKQSKAHSFEVALKGSINNPPQAEAESENVTFDIMLSGAFDALNVADAKVDAKLKGTVTGNTEVPMSATVDAALLLDHENVWFNVMSFDLQGEGVPALPSMITSLFDSWYMLPLPPEVQQDIQNSFTHGGVEEMTPEMKEMMSLWEEANVFENPQYTGTENIMGSPSWKYDVTVNKQAALEFLKKVAQMQGENTAELDAAMNSGVLDSFNFKANVWVDTATGYMSQISGTMDILATDATNGGSGTFSFRVTVGNFDKPVTLNIPPDAKPFPVETLMGMMLGGVPITNSPAMMEGAMGDASTMDTQALMEMMEAQGMAQ